MSKCKKIGIITPSSPAAGFFPERYKRGLSMLGELGLEYEEGDFVTTVKPPVAADAPSRASDIHRMYENDDIGLIIATIGGNYCAEILPYLDYELIKNNPKGLIGYSDITILLNAIAKKGEQVVYYGPTLMTEFSEYPKGPEYSMKAFMNALNSDAPLVIRPTDTLYSEGTDWSLAPTERVLDTPVFSKTIRPGTAHGTVIGGCVESLGRLRGTEYWPSLDGAILLLETSEGVYDNLAWRAVISDYINMGVFDKVAGIIIGQKKWTEAEVDSLSEMLLDATRERPIPIFYGLPFGHISPITTLPLYASATMDADNKTLSYDFPIKYSYKGGKV